MLLFELKKLCIFAACPNSRKLNPNDEYNEKLRKE